MPEHALNMSALSASSYMPASQAAELGTLASRERTAERAALARARDEFATSLASRAPPWKQFRAQVAQLSTSLAASQKASKLTGDAVALSGDAAPGDAALPQAALDALHDSQRVAANLALLARVRAVAEQMRALRERDGPLPASTRSLSECMPPQHGGSQDVCSQSTVAAAAGSIVSSTTNFIGRARDIAAARAATAHEELATVEALAPIREELALRRASMRSEWQTLLLHGVYGVPQNARDVEATMNSIDPVSSTSRLSIGKLSSNNAGLSSDVPSIASSFMPQLPMVPDSPEAPAVNSRVKPEPAGFVPVPMPVQDALPEIVQALDTLCGVGHSCDAVKSAAGAQVRAVVHHAIRSEIKLAENCGEGDPFSEEAGNVKTRRNAFFTAESQSFIQKLSCAIINRVSYHSLGTLRRAVALGIALQKEGIPFLAAINEIHDQVVNGFALVLDALLGSTMDDGCMPESRKPSSWFSMTSVCSKATSLSGNRPWRRLNQLSGEVSDLLNVHPMRNILSSGGLTIYNLELVHGVLRRFICECERLMATLVDPESKQHQPPLCLNSILSDMTATFLRSLRHDLRLFVRGAVGNRVGSLLQPPRMKKRSCANEANSEGTVPAPPHVQPLAHAIAVCLRIAISIPEIAQQVGAAVALDVLATLNHRSKEALKLATHWTDAGKLAEQLTYGGDAEDFDQGDTLESLATLSELQRSMPSHRARTREVTRVLLNMKNAFGEISLVDSSSLRLLSQIEWRAIVQLIFGLNSIMEEIRLWCEDVKTCQDGAGLDASFVPRWSSAMSSSNGESSSSPLEKLRMHIGKGSGNNEFALVRTICAVLCPIEHAINTLDADVVVPAVGLLRAETMLRCHWLVARSLYEVETACETPARKRRASQTETRLTIAATLVGDNIYDESMSSSGDDTSSRLYDFDEYGDRKLDDMRRLFVISAREFSVI